MHGVAGAWAGMQRRCRSLAQKCAIGCLSRMQVCGKGDAKKWKSSIWLQGPDGGQEQVRTCSGFLLCLKPILTVSPCTSRRDSHPPSPVVP